MPRKPVTPDIADEVYGYLKALGDKGGTIDDLFRMCDLPDSVIRDATFALQKQERATREAPRSGPGQGSKPHIWRAKVKEEAEPTSESRGSTTSRVPSEARGTA